MKSSEELAVHIGRHKLLLKKFLRTSREMLNLNLDEDQELLEQILEVRNKQLEQLSGVFQRIEELKRGMPRQDFMSQIKVNDRVVEEILELDREIELKLREKQRAIGKDLESLIANKQAIGNYKRIEISLPRLIDKV